MPHHITQKALGACSPFRASTHTHIAARTLCISNTSISKLCAVQDSSQVYKLLRRSSLINDYNALQSPIELNEITKTN